jgi:carbamoylphosphate synthase small subunit
VPAAEVTHVNLNDGVVEGLACRDVPAFSVQYHPEAGPGPHDARYLFAEFEALMDHPERFCGRTSSPGVTSARRNVGEQGGG